MRTSESGQGLTGPFRGRRGGLALIQLHGGEENVASPQHYCMFRKEMWPRSDPAFGGGWDGVGWGRGVGDVMGCGPTPIHPHGVLEYGSRGVVAVLKLLK